MIFCFCVYPQDIISEDAPTEIDEWNAGRRGQTFLKQLGLRGSPFPLLSCAMELEKPSSSGRPTPESKPGLSALGLVELHVHVTSAAVWSVL